MHRSTTGILQFPFHGTSYANLLTSLTCTRWWCWKKGKLGNLISFVKIQKYNSCNMYEMYFIMNAPVNELWLNVFIFFFLWNKIHKFIKFIKFHSLVMLKKRKVANFYTAVGASKILRIECNKKWLKYPIFIFFNSALYVKFYDFSGYSVILLMKHFFFNLNFV